MENMKRTIKNINDILSGKRSPSIETQFVMVCWLLVCIRAVTFIRFTLLNNTVLYWYSLASAIFFACIASFVKKHGQLFTNFCYVYFEIIFFGFLTSMIVGWDWGFALYYFPLIPAAYYVCYSLKSLKRKYWVPIAFNVIDIICFIVSRVMSTNVVADLHDYNIISAQIFNSIFSFVMLALFCMFFAITILRNETKLETQYTELSRISSHDPLTGLLNRRSMDTHLNAALETFKVKGQRFCIVIADIDNFKRINDTYGHNTGDDVLIMVANTIRDNIPEGTEICRWGGEEILLLLPMLKEDAVKAADKIRKAIRDSRTTARDEFETVIQITMTFGVAEAMPGYSMTKMVSLADENLYYGKTHGKNQVVS